MRRCRRKWVHFSLFSVSLSFFFFCGTSKGQLQEAITPDPNLVRVATGYEFPEGPAYDGKNSIYFSNCTADYITKLTLTGKAEIAYRANHAKDGPFTFLKTNGLTFYKDGSLFACDFERNAIIRIYPNGRQELVVDRCNGQPFRGPNDLAFDPKGYLFFTDPSGSDATHRIGAIYRVDIEKHIAYRVADGLAFPNGLAFSADGNTLYLCEDNLNRILLFHVHSNGSLGAPVVFANLDADGRGHPDGMAVDRAGHIWVAHYGLHRVVELDREGRIVGHIQLPMEGQGGPTNLEYAGKDMRSLYITDPGAQCVYKIRMREPGLKLFCAPPNKAKGV